MSCIINFHDALALVERGLGALIILVPLANLLGNKMNDMAYGAYMRRLEESIRKMEEGCSDNCGT